MTPTPTPPMPASGLQPACDVQQGCITCGDEGVVMRVVAVEEDGLGACEAADGAREAVDLSLVSPVGPGDEVLVHAGVALVRLGEGEAEWTAA
jgi:hydrogenase maturation factor